jgi:DNA-binding transcriptional regulator GbsR (MarR family)
MAEKEMVFIFDGLTNETVSREINDKEKEALESLAKEQKAKQDEIKAKEEARESALAKLAKLGLTEEEIASL